MLEEQEPMTPHKFEREQKQPRKSNKWSQSVLELTWLPEFSSLFLAILALIATVVLLELRRDKPQPDLPSLININALVAIFSTILKAALLFAVAECISELKWIWFASPQPVSDFDRFDSASRGPWGAFLLLLKRPGSIVTALGSLITIVSLATDPFAQQVLRFNTCLRPENGSSATIARTNNYTDGALRVAVGQPALTVPMTAALYQGLLDPPANGSSIMSAYCPSGNCTFPNANETTYTSLAMCSSVEDITQTIRDNTDPDDESSFYETYNFTLPSGLILPGTCVLATGVAQPVPQAENDPLLTVEALMVNTNCSGPSSRGSSSSGGGDCSATPFAIRATLRPCIHKYTKVSYSNSIFSETIASTTDLPYIPDFRYYSLAGDYPALPSTNCTPSRNPSGSNTEATNTLEDGTRYHNGPSPLANDTADTRHYDPGCIYDFGSGPVEALGIAFRGPIFGYTARPANLSTPRGLGSLPIGNAWLSMLYGGGKADMASSERYFEGLATSMTAAMREGGDAVGSEPARGTVMARQTCVGVDWAWLALPVVLIVFTGVLLCVTVVMSRRFRLVGEGGEGDGGMGMGRRRKAWKSSSLPLLWCGFGDGIRDRYDGFDGVREMKVAGDGLNVRLERQEGYEGGHNKPWREGKSRWMLKED